MKKVVYSVQRLGRFDNPKLTGVGCIADNSLIIAMMSKNGKPYIKAFQDIYEYIHPLVGRDQEFGGQINEFLEIEVEKDTNGYKSMEKVEIEVEYKIWFKYV